MGDSYGLTIHPEKTKLVKFGKPPKKEQAGPKNETFDFLGFTHYVGQVAARELGHQEKDGPETAATEYQIFVAMVQGEPASPSG